MCMFTVVIVCNNICAIHTLMFITITTLIVYVTLLLRITIVSQIHNHYVLNTYFYTPSNFTLYLTINYNNYMSNHYNVSYGKGL